MESGESGMESKIEGLIVGEKDGETEGTRGEEKRGEKR